MMPRRCRSLPGVPFALLFAAAAACTDGDAGSPAQAGGSSGRGVAAGGGSGTAGSGAPRGGSTAGGTGGLAGPTVAGGGGAAGQPISGKGGAAGQPISGKGGAAGQPISGKGGAAGQPISGKGGAAGQPMAGKGGAAGQGMDGKGGTAGQGIGGEGGVAGSAMGGSAAASGQGGAAPAEAFPLHPGAPPLSPYLVVDQLGYRRKAQKIAIARDPVVGFDASEAYAPGKLAVVNAATGAVVLMGVAKPWKGGQTDAQAGDAVSWLDFSSLETEGRYYVADIDKSVRSPTFSIGDGVYRRVLEAAVRTFFYQRAGQDKPAKWAGEGWADGPSHLGAGQDLEARRYDAPGDAGTARDVSGGWYDAGDYNKYTVWTARYATTLLHAYAESPTAFGDDTRIPESGNGIPDIVDEARFGLAHLGRLQEPDGSVLSIVGVAHASPPSAAKGPSRYGKASTTATRGAAVAYAYAALVLGKIPALADEAKALRARAEKAFAWAEANPGIVFKNNTGENGTSGLGAGQQELSDDGRKYGWDRLRLEGALYLHLLSGDASYRAIVEELAPTAHLLAWPLAYPFEGDEQAALLTYATLPSAVPATAKKILSTWAQAMQSDENLGAFASERDGYGAYLKDYTWGTNRTRATQGTMFGLFADGQTGKLAADAAVAAERYVHALHGVNPLGIVYLSNVASLGAERSVREFYHAWFEDGSALWDRAGVSKYGPAPGFLVGGPNPSYDVDGCCATSCGAPENDAKCSAEPLSPPKGQPPQKSFKEFNTGWPVASWAVTENSNGYQVEYIRLVARFSR